ncbi:Fes1-domain-containing protein [Biscogniauxia marginata]|nr:Fes1-domain-containing protein [Biscogniauxia marginata]
MADKNLNELLKWSIENSAPNGTTTGASAPAPASAPATSLNAEALVALMGAPSDAELMQAAMSCITSPDAGVTAEARLTAFDNLEQLVESLDNANLLARLGLWTPLLGCLGCADARLRRMAAWCVGTAVQNNEPCQERLVALGGVERLVRMALGELVSGGDGDGDGDGDAAEKEEEEEKEAETETTEVRRKALYALSSAVRNYQPAMDVCAAELRKQGEAVPDKVDATDMDAVDEVINALKTKVMSA